MRYSVIVDVRAAKEIRRLPRHEQVRITAKMEALANGPRPPGCVKLAGSGELWRVRAGDYRIIYQVMDSRKIVDVVKVGHRREVYRGF